MAPGLGHKSPSIHIFQADAGFCPAGARRLERAAIRPAPPGVRSQGQLNVWPLRPFDWCGPAMSQLPPRSAPCPHAPMPRASHHNRPHQTAFSSSPKNRDGRGGKKDRPPVFATAYGAVKSIWLQRNFTTCPSVIDAAVSGRSKNCSWETSAFVLLSKNRN